MKSTGSRHIASSRVMLDALDITTCEIEHLRARVSKGAYCSRPLMYNQSVNQEL